MKKLLSLLLVLLLCVSAMPTVSFATTNNKVIDSVYVPSGTVKAPDSPDSNKIDVVISSDAGEYFYVYTKKTTAADAPVNYSQRNTAINEMTFMLTAKNSSIGYRPVYTIDNGTTYDWDSQLITISETGGVVISNVKGKDTDYIFTETDVRWSNHKLTLIPYVTMNEKHTIRVEHDPDNLRFTVWFDSNKITLTENAAHFLVESTATSDGDIANMKGPRFTFAGANGDTLRVYDIYIRGTQGKNNDKTVTSKTFSEAREYSYAGDDSDNLFSYYVDSNNNAVITGFKYGVNPSSEDNKYTKSNPLVFPSSINGHTVIAIADWAFNENSSGDKTKTSSQYARWSNITAIELPNTLKTIGQYSMVCFKQLGSLTLSDSVETIGNYAFANIDQPTALDLGNSLKTIGAAAFNSFGKANGVINLVVIPESVESIGNQAFTLSCVQTIVFEGTPTTVGTYMFRNNPTLDKVVFLKDLTLGANFFGGDNSDGKNRVTVENKFTVIGSSEMLAAVKNNITSAGFSEIDFTTHISYEDIYVYKSASTPSVYYWGTDNDATLIKAQYNKSTKELASCVPVIMTAGNSYALELGNSTYDVKNMFWSMNDCKPLIAPVEY